MSLHAHIAGLLYPHVRQAVSHTFYFEWKVSILVVLISGHFVMAEEQAPTSLHSLFDRSGLAPNPDSNLNQVEVKLAE